jgi:hypothetical protein
LCGIIPFDSLYAKGDAQTVQSSDINTAGIRFHLAARIFNKLPTALNEIVDDQIFVRKLNKNVAPKDVYDLHELMLCDFDTH